MFDRRHSIIFGYHSFKSVAFSNIFSFTLTVKRLMILILFLFFLCFVYFFQCLMFFFYFLIVLVTVEKICLHKFNIFCFFRFLEKLQNG